MRIFDGDVLCVFGQDWKINQSEIGGDACFLDRRVRDIIKKQFGIKVREIIRTMPPMLRPKKISIRDTRSRWGSCSSSGTISLSWRLSFAPPEVMLYVIIHECCHLEQMNHSVKFWALVGHYFGPGYENAKKWLRKNGQILFA